MGVTTALTFVGELGGLNIGWRVALAAATPHRLVSLLRIGSNPEDTTFCCLQTYLFSDGGNIGTGSGQTKKKLR